MMPQFIVKIIDGKRGVMLCDERGVPLPNQRDVTLRSPLREANTITVEFLIDGERIAFASKQSQK